MSVLQHFWPVCRGGEGVVACCGNVVANELYLHTINYLIRVSYIENAHPDL